MILYHGSNMIVDKPQIMKSDRFLDFGTGFYTTTNYNQARSFALKVVNRKGSGKPIVNYYEFDDNSKLKMKSLIFDKPNEQWLDFVSNCRNGIDNSSNDLIVGPVADDSVYQTFILYSNDILTKEQTIDALKVKNLFNQYVFKNDFSLISLKYLKSEEVK